MYYKCMFSSFSKINSLEELSSPKSIQKSKVRLDLAAFIFLGTTTSLIKFAKF